MLYKQEYDADQLVLDNVDLLDAAARYVPHGQTAHTRDDLRQEGFFGLAHAAKNWDQTRPFRPYARACVSGAMRTAVMRTGDTVRLPDHKRRVRSRVRQARAALCEQNGENPDDSTVAVAAGVSETVVRENLTGTYETVQSLAPDHQIPAGQPDSATARVDELVADAEMTERENQIVNLAFGLVHGIEMTTGEIADELSLSTQQVTRAKRSALEKMRAAA